MEFEIDSRPTVDNMTNDYITEVRLSSEFEIDSRPTVDNMTNDYITEVRRYPQSLKLIADPQWTIWQMIT